MNRLLFLAPSLKGRALLIRSFLGAGCGSLFAFRLRFLQWLLAFGMSASLLVTTPALADLLIDGAGDELEENLRLYLQSMPLQVARPSTQRRALTAAQEAAEALGYYDASFHLTSEGDDWRLVVKAGDRVRWQVPELRVNDQPWLPGDDEVDLTPSGESLWRQMSNGAGLDHRDYEKFKQGWLQNWQQRGYWQARYQHAELRVDLPVQQAVTQLQLISGPQFHLRDLQFTGSELAPKLLQRLADFAADDVVTQTKIQQLYRNLENSNYFSQIDVDVDHLPVNNASDTGRTDITVDLADSPGQWYSVGAGYGTDTGVRGRFRLENPHINRRGHRLVNDFQLSTMNQEWSANYQIPLLWEGKNPLETRFEASASYQHETVEGTDSTIWSVGGYYSDVWGKGWQLRTGVSLYAEEEIVGEESAKNTLYAIPALYLSRLKAPLTLDPLHGHSEVLSLSGSSPSLGADTFFVRLQASYKQLFSLGGSQTLLARVEGGVVWTDEITDVPYSQRFFAGGDQSVRGYDYNALSVRNADGTVRGGRYLNTGSLEYSVKVLPSWRVAVFSDAGRAYDDASEPWNISAGVGLRWLSPIGSVRIDLAAPINNDSYSGVRLHISMGGVL